MSSYAIYLLGSILRLFDTFGSKFDKSINSMLRSLRFSMTSSVTSSISPALSEMIDGSAISKVPNMPLSSLISVDL